MVAEKEMLVQLDQDQHGQLPLHRRPLQRQEPPRGLLEPDEGELGLVEESKEQDGRVETVEQGSSAGTSMNEKTS